MKKPLLKRHLLILCAIVVCTIAFTSISFFQKYQAENEAVIYVGDKLINSTEYNFYYAMIVNSYYSTYGPYTKQMGLDIEEDLSTQECLFDGYSTWKDFFTSMTENTIREHNALCNDAKEHNFIYDTSSNWNNFLEQVKNQANNNDLTMSNMFKIMYGKYATEKKIKVLFEQYDFANNYKNYILKNTEVSEEDLVAAYEEDKNQYDVISYLEYDVYANINEESTEEDIEKAMSEAQKRAKEIFDGIYDEETFEELAKKDSEKKFLDIRHENEKYSDVPTIIRDWLFKCEEEKQTVYIKDDSEKCFRIVYFISRERNDSNTATVRQILITPESSTGSYLPTEEDYENALKKAEDIKKEYETGEKTEDTFSVIATEKSKDIGSAKDGGLLSMIEPGSYETEMDEWIFDESRKPGDIGIVRTTYGYHILYFVEWNEPIWRIQLRENIKLKKMNEYIEEITKNYDIRHISIESAEIESSSSTLKTFEN